MRHHFLKSVGCGIAAIIVSMAVPAWATSYTSVTYDNTTSGIGIYLNGKKTSITTVAFTVGLQQEYELETVKAFCVEPTQYAANGKKLSLPVDLVTPSSVNGGLQAAWLIDYVMNSTPNLYGDKKKVAALQLSIWEVITEDEGPYDIFKGAFQLSNKKDALAPYVSTLLGALNQNFANADLAYLNSHFAIAQHPDKQDFILVGVNANPTPEPSTMMLTLIGILLMSGGGFARFMKSRIH